VISVSGLSRGLPEVIHGRTTAGADYVAGDVERFYGFFSRYFVAKNHYFILKNEIV
jgi:hypothetical protein